MFPHTPDREGRRSCRSADGAPRPLQTGTGGRTDDESQVWEDEAIARRTSPHPIPAEYESNLRRLTVTDVPDFAEMLVIDPGIVIRRLQHDGLIRLIAPEA
jgi:hypothetical protein